VEGRGERLMGGGSEKQRNPTNTRDQEGRQTSTDEVEAQIKVNHAHLEERLGKPQERIGSRR
jgi:hypothetical protein